MGLAVTANFEPNVLLTGGNYDSNGGSEIGGIGATTWPGVLFYYDRLDFFAGYWNPGTGAGAHVRWDPLLANNTGVLFDDVAGPGTISGTSSDRFAVGEWNKAANTQKIYQYVNGATLSKGFVEIQPLAFNQVVTSDPWPNVGNANSRGLISTDIGYYDQATTTGWAIFETWGYAFCAQARVRHTDNVQYAGVPALVNLSTGAATILAGTNNFYTAFGSQTHFFSEPALFGQTVDFFRVQFVPDDSSTPAAPRGAMYMFSLGTNSPDDAAKTRMWVMAVDWNPLNVSATPSRVHLRRRLLSAVDLTKNSGGTLSGIYENVATITKAMLYHPRTNRLIFVSAVAGGPSGGQLDANEMKFLFISPSPSVYALSEPSPTETIASGKTVEFSVDVLGSLQEQIGGVDVDFTLTRVSTIDEVLAVTPSAGETVTLAHTVNPTDPNLSPIVVKKNGVALVETTNYTLNRAASQITFVAPEPVGGATYTASYRHLTTQVSPATGAALLNGSAVSDLGGAAIARVQFAEEDPVADRWYRLDATQA